MKKKNKYIGSTLDSFLKEEKIKKPKLNRNKVLQLKELFLDIQFALLHGNLGMGQHKILVAGGNNNLVVLKKPKIKMFLRAVEGIDSEPFIMIRHW